MSLSLAGRWVRSEAFSPVSWAVLLDWECWLSMKQGDQESWNSILNQHLCWPRIVLAQFAYSQLAR